MTLHVNHCGDTYIWREDRISVIPFGAWSGSCAAASARGQICL